MSAHRRFRRATAAAAVRARLALAADRMLADVRGSSDAEEAGGALIAAKPGGKVTWFAREGALVRECGGDEDVYDLGLARMRVEVERRPGGGALRRGGLRARDPGSPAPGVAGAGPLRGRVAAACRRSASIGSPACPNGFRGCSMTRARRHRPAAALMLALAALVILGALGTALGTAVMRGVAATREAAARDLLLNVAESGVDYALSALARDPAWTGAGPVAVPGGECTVTAVRKGEGHVITSRAVAEPRPGRRAAVRVEARSAEDGRFTIAAWERLK